MGPDLYQIISSDGKIYPVKLEGLSFGRQPDNDVILEDLKVSRQHARLLLAGGRCWIRDLNTPGGTFLNGKRVVGQQEMRPEDQLVIGAAQFRLTLAKGENAQDGDLRQPSPTVGSITRPNRQAVAMIFVGAAFVVLIIVALLMVSGPLSPTRVEAIGETSQASLTPSALGIVAENTVTSPELSADSSLPQTYLASIRCPNAHLLLADYLCTVSNLGTGADTLGLWIKPFLLAETNQFDILVVSGQQFRLDDRGYVSLGEYQAGEERTVVVRFICLAAAGCPLTKVHVQLAVKSGQELITGPQGELDLSSLSSLPTSTPRPYIPPTATKKAPEPPASPEPTSPPVVPTNTPEPPPTVEPPVPSLSPYPYP